MNFTVNLPKIQHISLYQGLDKKQTVIQGMKILIRNGDWAGNQEPALWEQMKQ